MTVYLFHPFAFNQCVFGRQYRFVSYFFMWSNNLCLLIGILTPLYLMWLLLSLDLSLLFSIWPFCFFCSYSFPTLFWLTWILKYWSIDSSSLLLFYFNYFFSGFSRYNTVHPYQTLFIRVNSWHSPFSFLISYFTNVNYIILFTHPSHPLCWWDHIFYFNIWFVIVIFTLSSQLI